VDLISYWRLSIIETSIYVVVLNMASQFMHYFIVLVKAVVNMLVNLLVLKKKKRKILD
jgi:hypothetical protein